MVATHIQQGKDAEAACCRFLRSQGLKLVCKNFHSRHGEIDIIMSHDDTLIFVEVRYRKNDLYGGGLESVTTSKQQKLRKTAEFYLQQNAQDKNARFDVVSMSKKSQTKLFGRDSYSFDWVKDAF